jgi:hypothetical protein
MKNTLFILFFAFNMVGQKIIYLDSTYIQYIKKNNTYYTLKTEPDDFLLDVAPYLRISTDEVINKSLSDSLATVYNKKKQKSSKITKQLEQFRDGIAIDSSLNVLFVKAQTYKCQCVNSLYNIVSGDDEIISLLKQRKCISVIINYMQVTKNNNYSIIFVTLKFRFNTIKNYSILIPA